MRWSSKPAEYVDTATTPRINMLRGLAVRATTPLLPDDYLKLLNPLWTARELRGEIVDVRNETAIIPSSECTATRRSSPPSKAQVKYSDW
jgi:hypothetical protein